MRCTETTNHARRPTPPNRVGHTQLDVTPANTLHWAAQLLPGNGPAVNYLPISGGGAISGGSPGRDPVLRHVVLDLRYGDFFAVENSCGKGLRCAQVAEIDEE